MAAKEVEQLLVEIAEYLDKLHNTRGGDMYKKKVLENPDKNLIFLLKTLKEGMPMAAGAIKYFPLYEEMKKFLGKTS